MTPSPAPTPKSELSKAELTALLGELDEPAAAPTTPTTIKASKTKVKQKSAAPLPEWKSPGALLTKEEATRAKAAKAAKIKQEAAAGKVSVLDIDGIRKLDGIL